MANQLSADIIIIGGGIAGLVTLHKCHAMGIQALLVESQALGQGQTIASQGIIHGGLKYAIKGFLNKEAKAIANMPAYWKACMNGEGELPLEKAVCLSRQQYLWSNETLGAQVSSFFASKLLSGKVNTPEKAARPTLFQHPDFKGQLYCLNEVVLDIPSVIHALYEPLKQFCLKIDEDSMKVQCCAKNVEQLTVTINQEPWALNARQFIFTAGENNQALLAENIAAPKMQRRPLHMVLAKGSHLPKLYAHCIGSSIMPRVTITTHTSRDGSSLWYIGGKIAEDGVQLTKEAQIQATQEALQQVLPWVSVEELAWATFTINRAEYYQPDGKKPSDATAFSVGNSIIAWPTKLALAPMLAEKIVAYINPSISEKCDITQLLEKLPKPDVALPLWEKLSFRTMYHAKEQDGFAD